MSQARKCKRCFSPVSSARLAAAPETQVCGDCVRTERCKRCSSPISESRLEMLPETDVCVACSRDIGGEFRYTIVPENMAKEGSLKKNYGGFSVHKQKKAAGPDRAGTADAR